VVPSAVVTAARRARVVGQLGLATLSSISRAERTEIVLEVFGRMIVSGGSGETCGGTLWGSRFMQLSF
jgi:hypothetical protein